MKDKKQGVAVFRIALKLFGYELFYFWSKRVRNTRKLEYLNSLEMSEINVVAPMVISEMGLNKFEAKSMKIRYAKLSSYLG